MSEHCPPRIATLDPGIIQMSTLPKWIDDEFYGLFEMYVEQNVALPDSAELDNLIMRAENMLRWGFPLRALQGYLGCLSHLAYTKEAHYECPLFPITVEVVKKTACIFHESFPLLADQYKPEPFAKGLSGYLKAGALGISMYLDVGMIVPMIFLADYLAARHESADAVPIYISALNHLQANPVSLLNSGKKQNHVTKALTMHFINIPRRYKLPQEYRIELEAVMPAIRRGLHQFEVTLGSDDPIFMQLHRRLAHTYLECDMEKQGEQHLTLLLQRSEKTVGPAHEQTKGLLESLIYYYWDRDRFSECDALIRRVLLNGGSVGQDTQSSIGGIAPGTVPSLKELGVPQGLGWAWNDCRFWLDPPETVELVPVHPPDSISALSDCKYENAECDTNIFRYTLSQGDDKTLRLTVPYIPYSNFQQSLESEKGSIYQDFMRLVSCLHHRHGLYRPHYRSILNELPGQEILGRQNPRTWTLSVVESRVRAADAGKFAFVVIKSADRSSISHPTLIPHQHEQLLALEQRTRRLGLHMFV